MDEETDVLDWENDNEYHSTQKTEHADEEEDRVSLGGDDADEDEYYQTRKDSTGPPPSSQVTEASNEGERTRQSTESSVTFHSEQHSAPQPPPAVSPKNPQQETPKAPPSNLTHALPPKPVAAVYAPRREPPSSTTAATSMRVVPKPKEPPLPPDWEMKASRSGSGWYYFNVRTLETTWIRPQINSERSARTSSDHRSTDLRHSAEPSRNGHGSRAARRPPSDPQPTSYAIEVPNAQMTYEDRHYRPGESDDIPPSEFSNHPRAVSSQQWDYDEGARSSRSSRRPSSLDRNSANHRPHARDSTARGLRDDPARSWQPADPAPSRHQSQQYMDSYVPSTEETRHRGRPEPSRAPARSGSPPSYQQPKSSRPRSPRQSYPPTQTQPVEPPLRKRQSRFDQPPSITQNGPQVVPPPPRDGEVDPYLPDELNIPPQNHRRDAWDSRRGPPEHNGGAFAQDEFVNAPQSYPSPPVKRAPLPPQDQYYQQARKHPRPRSLSPPPRAIPPRDERSYGEPVGDFGADMRQPDDGYGDPGMQVPKGPRGSATRDLPPAPPVPPPETKKWRKEDGQQNSRLPNAVRRDSRFGAPMAPPAPPFGGSISSSNSTPIPNNRRFGQSIPPSTVPRNESAPMPPGYSNGAVSNRPPVPPIPPVPTSQPVYDEYERVDAPLPPMDASGRVRRASLSERMTPMPSVPVDIPQRPPNQRQYSQSYEPRKSPTMDRGHRHPTRSPENSTHQDLPPNLDDSSSRFRPREQDEYRQPPSETPLPQPPRPQGPSRWDPHDTNGSASHPTRGKFGEGKRGNRRQPRESMDMDQPKASSLLERMSIGEGPPSLSERVQVPNKRDFEGEEDQDSFSKKRRKNKRGGGRRGGGIGQMS